MLRILPDYMKDVFYERVLFFTPIIWLLAAYANQQLGIIVTVASFLLIFRKKRIEDAFLLFFIALTFSDSRLHLFKFMATAKVYITPIMAFYAFFRIKEYPYYIKMLLPFVIIAIISLFRSDHFYISLQKTLSYFFIYGIGTGFFIYSYQKDKELFIKRLFGVTSWILLIGIILHILGFYPITTLIGRYRGLLGNPNEIAMYCSLLFFLYQVIIYFKPTIFSKKEKRFLLVLIFLSLLLSQSRTGIFSIVIFYTIRFLLNFSLLFAIALLVSVTLYFDNIQQLFVETVIALGLEDFFRLGTLEEGSGRVIAWNFIWRFINQEAFFIGKGFTATENLFYSYGQHLSMLGHQGHAHNVYLTLWYDTGLIGLIFLISVILFYFFKHYIQFNNKIALAILFAVLFYINFESWLAASLNPFTIIFIMIMAALYIFEEKPAELEKQHK